MWLFYRPRGSNFGLGAGLGTLGFLGFLVLLGFLPFYVIYLAVRIVIWCVIWIMYAAIILAAKLHKAMTGKPPVWRLHPVPDLIDEWLDERDIVKIPHRRVLSNGRGSVHTPR